MKLSIIGVVILLFPVNKAIPVPYGICRGNYVVMRSEMSLPLLPQTTINAIFLSAIKVFVWTVYCGKWI